MDIIDEETFFFTDDDRTSYDQQSIPSTLGSVKTKRSTTTGQRKADVQPGSAVINYHDNMTIERISNCKKMLETSARTTRTTMNTQTFQKES
eukprot:5964261-Amphidinium_carterae.2